MLRPIRVVPHTHWDREWYLPFEDFVARLVPVLDLVLDLLAADDQWRFHLDGQTAMIDDYLARRPERAEALRACVRAGRATCGPWVSLVDEFLVSGESIIRNLEDGIARSAALGGTTKVGYLPDQFGHISQMPQILNSFGITSAVVWRGVPAAITKTRFTWTAPDGSSLATQYLPLGYGQGGAMPVTAGEFVERLRAEQARTAPFLDDGEVMLLMAGDDHEPPLPQLPALVASARAEGLDATIATLAEQVAGMPDPVQEWTGELRSAARANLLPNTYSVRPRQKAERARAENLLERYAEPLAALVPGEAWPRAELDEAWMLLHLNGAHDSVCGCSTDEVAHAVDERTRRVTAIAEGIVTRGLDRLGAACSVSGMVAFNPSGFERNGVPALGWLAGDVRLPRPRPVTLSVDGDAIAIGDTGCVIRFEDQGDEGDLYTFCPSDEPVGPLGYDMDDGVLGVRFLRCDVLVRAEWVAGEPFVRLLGAVHNRVPDHRVRMILDLPEAVEHVVAGSPFALVERPRMQEGGPSEPPSPHWPARGLVVGAGRGLLAAGVFEYEPMGDALAVALARCTGGISRLHSLATRRRPAGPDVATPEAQLIGSTPFEFGVLTADPRARVLEIWEQYALPIVTTAASGAGTLPERGSWLDLDVPALSSVRIVEGELRVTVWNPWPRLYRGRVGSVAVDLAPHRVETVRVL